MATIVVSVTSSEDDIFFFIDSHIDVICGHHNDTSSKVIQNNKHGVEWEIECRDKDVKQIVYYLSQYASVTWGQ